MLEDCELGADAGLLANGGPGHRRVSQEREKLRDGLANLRRIGIDGIDEISYPKGQRHVMVVVDHDSGRVVWTAPPGDAKSRAPSSTCH